MNRIEITNFAVEVTGDRTAALDALTETAGTYRRSQRAYIFPRSMETRVREALATSPAPAPAQAAPMTPGWSKAARRRAGGRTAHPLGDVAYRGNGYTEYHDGLRGDGVVQIWDES